MFSTGFFVGALGVVGLLALWQLAKSDRLPDEDSVIQGLLGLALVGCVVGLGVVIGEWQAAGRLAAREAYFKEKIAALEARLAQEQPRAEEEQA